MITFNSRVDYNTILGTGGDNHEQSSTYSDYIAQNCETDLPGKDFIIRISPSRSRESICLYLKVCLDVASLSASLTKSPSQV